MPYGMPANKMWCPDQFVTAHYLLDIITENILKTIYTWSLVYTNAGGRDGISSV